MLLEVSISPMLEFMMTIKSRSAEFAADRYSISYGYALALRNSLIALHVKNAGNLVPDDLYALCHFSHPGLVERIKAIDEYMGELVNMTVTDKASYEEAKEKYVKEFSASIIEMHGQEAFDQQDVYKTVEEENEQEESVDNLKENKVEQEDDDYKKVE